MLVTKKQRLPAARKDASASATPSTGPSGVYSTPSQSKMNVSVRASSWPADIRAVLNALLRRSRRHSAAACRWPPSARRSMRQRATWTGTRSARAAVFPCVRTPTWRTALEAHAAAMPSQRGQQLMTRRKDRRRRGEDLSFNDSKITTAVQCNLEVVNTSLECPG